MPTSRPAQRTTPAPRPARADRSNARLKQPTARFSEPGRFDLVRTARYLLAPIRRAPVALDLASGPSLLSKRAATRSDAGDAMTPRLYIGTAGLSVWYSDDLGETLHRFWGTSGLYSETRVWALASHPARPRGAGPRAPPGPKRAAPPRGHR